MEISLLNALTKVNEEERESKLIEIISKYPEVIKVIPLIIAIREKNILVLELGEKLFYKEFELIEHTNRRNRRYYRVLYKIRYFKFIWRNK